MDEKQKKKIDDATEMTLYFIINEIGGFIWRMNHDMADGRIEKEHHAAIDADIEKMRPLQTYAVEQTPKFGVEKPLDDEKRPTNEYWAWFRWWDSYIKGMTDDEWNELNGKMRSEEDVSSYRPEGDWRDKIETAGR